MTDTKALVEAGDAGRLEQAERDKFEKWALESKCLLSLSDHKDVARYALTETEVAWRAWQARASECAGLRAELDAAKRRIGELETGIVGAIDIVKFLNCRTRAEHEIKDWAKDARAKLKGD